MKKLFPIYLIIILLLLGSNTMNAQKFKSKKKNPFNISLDLMSRYVWRGTDYGGSPSIQPGIEFNKAGFTIGAWGAYATNYTGAQEVDLYISYNFLDMFSVSLTDYFFPDELFDYKYFDFNKSTTGHILEATVLFKGTKKIPVSALMATNFWGADARRIDLEGNTGDIQYSSYAEITYSHKFFDIFIGANLTSVDLDIGESGFYGDKAGLVNIGFTTSKEIKISNKITIPLTVSLITNPQAEKIYFVAGLSF